MAPDREIETTSLELPENTMLEMKKRQKKYRVRIYDELSAKHGPDGGAGKPGRSLKKRKPNANKTILLRGQPLEKGDERYTGGMSYG